MNYINVVGVSFTLFLLIFIIRKKQKENSDYLLILLNLLMAGILLTDLWVKVSLNQYSFLFQDIISFLIFPTFISYALLLIHENKLLKRNWPIFWIFAITFSLFILIDFIFLNDYQSNDIQKLYKTPPLSYHFFYKSQKIFIIVCLFWLLRKVKIYLNKVKNAHSFIDPYNLRWLINFSRFYIIINFISLIIFLLYNFGIVPKIETVFLILNILLVISLFYLSFYGVKQYAMVEIHRSLQIENKEVEKKKVEQKKLEKKNTRLAKAEHVEKYKTSSLSNREMEKLYDEIVQLFEEEKIFLESQLQIKDLAESLNVNNNKVSQTINLIGQKPFYDFVNGYRVAYLKQMLANPDNKQYTILALGLESGFNSKASLNRIFRQFEGQSPREYQKTHLNN